MSDTKAYPAGDGTPQSFITPHDLPVDLTCSSYSTVQLGWDEPGGTKGSLRFQVRPVPAVIFEGEPPSEHMLGQLLGQLGWPATLIGVFRVIINVEMARLAAPALAQPVAPRVNEKDIDRWRALTQERPEGPWQMGCGGSFDRTIIAPISDDMLAELANWLRMGYTPWNGRSIPLSGADRQFMFMLYYSVQGLIARVRTAEEGLAASAHAVAGEVRSAEIATLTEWRKLLRRGDADVVELQIDEILATGAQRAPYSGASDSEGGEPA